MNRARGEAALSVGGERLTLRPSFEALVAAEEELGPLFALVERAAEGRLEVSEMAALFWHCVAARPESVTRERIGQGKDDRRLDICRLAFCRPGCRNVGAGSIIGLVASVARQ